MIRRCRKRRSVADSLRVFPPDPPALAALRSRLPLQSAADLDSRLDVLPTGNPALDAALGGGLAQRRVHLLTGTRGGGAASLLHLLLATALNLLRYAAWLAERPLARTRTAAFARLAPCPA